MSAPSPLAVNNCDESPQDEAIIEYFNEMSFLDSFQLIVRDIGTAYSVALDCPTGDGQPGGFLFQLATADQSQIIDCNSAAITFDKSELHFGTLDDCDERLLCRLLATLSHEETGTVYSQTTIDIQFTIGMAETFIPTLDPATLPQCTQPLTACLQDGSCQVTTSKQGAIQLCESADACAQPTVTPANEITTGYSYNDQIYFQTAIQSVVKGT